MRRLAPLAVLLLAACSGVAPKSPPVVASAPAPVAERGDLIGLTAEELVQRFGQPDLQVVEGAGVKLQFRAERCVLDAFLYRSGPGAGIARVTHVEARDREGRDSDTAGCVTVLADS